MTNAARCLARYYALVDARLCTRCKEPVGPRNGTECEACARDRAERVALRRVPTVQLA